MTAGVVDVRRYGNPQTLLRDVNGLITLLKRLARFQKLKRVFTHDPVAWPPNEYKRVCTGFWAFIIAKVCKQQEHPLVEGEDREYPGAGVWATGGKGWRSGTRQKKDDASKLSKWKKSMTKDPVVYDCSNRMHLEEANSPWVRIFVVKRW